MTRIRVDPRMVQHVEMGDGTRYPVGRNGWVEVTRPDHASAVEKGAARHDVAEAGFLPPMIGYVARDGRSCPTCGFAAWPWTAACPRDGTAL